jgi:uncharacterized protein (TIGR02147 family)
MNQASEKISASSAALLMNALKRLQTENRRLSVRSVAAQLKLSPSHVNKIFRGERELPLKLVNQFSRVLQLDHHEVVELQRLALTAHAERELRPGIKIGALREQNTALMTEYETLGGSDLWILERWYYFAILNLVTTQNFDSSPEHIATRLGISESDAQKALDRLTESGHLVSRGGRIERRSEKLRFPTQRSHLSLRIHHQAMIRKALDKLQGVPTEKDFADRLISSVTFAADPEKIEQAKLILEEAVYRAANFLANGEGCTEVYQINLQLFSLTKSEK